MGGNASKERNGGYDTYCPLQCWWLYYRSGKQTKQIEQKKEVKETEREQKKNANKWLKVKGRRRYLENIFTKKKLILGGVRNSRESALLSTDIQAKGQKSTRNPNDRFTSSWGDKRSMIFLKSLTHLFAYLFIFDDDIPAAVRATTHPSLHIHTHPFASCTVAGPTFFSHLQCLVVPYPWWLA